VRTHCMAFDVELEGRVKLLELTFWDIDIEDAGAGEKAAQERIERHIRDVLASYRGNRAQASENSVQTFFQQTTRSRRSSAGRSGARFGTEDPVEERPARDPASVDATTTTLLTAGCKQTATRGSA